MKKTSESRTKRVFNRIFNVRTWADWDRMKSFTLYLTRGIKNLFVPQEKELEESFAAAQARLNLSDADMQVRQKSLYRLSLLMVVMAFLLFGYAIYHLVLANFLACILSLVVMTIALVLAFRYHFWYFQIKQRKLGCSLHEWFRQGLMGDKR